MSGEFPASFSGKTKLFFFKKISVIEQGGAVATSGGLPGGSDNVEFRKCTGRMDLRMHWHWQRVEYSTGMESSEVHVPVHVVGFKYCNLLLLSNGKVSNKSTIAYQQDLLIWG